MDTGTSLSESRGLVLFFVTTFAFWWVFWMPKAYAGMSSLENYHGPELRVK